jgi:aldose sugar dehydrogenase
MQKIAKLKLLVLLLFLLGLAAYLVTDNFSTRKVHAYSSGPPAGFTHAPGEFDCAECHLPQPDAGTGNIQINAPQAYVPGQTYQITVTHANADPTRLRWGFQLTALDDSNSKAGDLQSTDMRTQVLDNQGPGSSRQYIEHTSSGTFINQQGGASWTFNWTAPATNVGPVTFYVAGNQANNDGNTSGDYVYFTFAQAQAAPVMPDFQLAAAPSLQTVAPGGNTNYNLRLTPANGFAGQVALSISGLPAGASASFNPSQVGITGAPIIITEPDSTRAIALESVTFRKEPFSLQMPVAFSPDTRNRIVFFVSNLSLLAGEGIDALTVDAEDAQHRHYNLNVESITPVPGNEWMSQVIVRLDDNLGDVGDVLVRMTLRGLASSRARIAIGHMGGGLPDDAGAPANTSVLTVTTSAGTPVGTYPLTITATSGSIQRTATVSLKVVSSTSADLSLTKTGSPNPSTVGTTLSYRLTITNNGPATATNVSVTDNLPASVTFVSASTTQGSCSQTTIGSCSLGSLANGASAVVTINVTPNVAGQLTNTASVGGAEEDPDTSNNTATISTIVDPQVAAPLLLDQNLAVRTIVSELNQPTSMAFLSAGEFFILERTTGRVQRVLNGQLQTPVLDLAVNNASERGLLGIALHPNFPATPYVYLYWTESSTGLDTSNTDDVALLGNRVDRFLWNGATLTLDRNLIRLRALQQDAGQPSRGNHNGGVLRFGPDGKLYIFMGDNGRRGLLQNITSGGPVPDDQFGGPEPDDAHLTGVILRFNDDGSTPTDNPFFNASTGLTGQSAANVKKIYAYGVRNGFGMAFDPVNGNLWTQENGDDAFDEINRVTPGFNGGWIQVMGPSSRVAEYKAIEVNRPGGLQQNRWSPTLIADTPAEALSRLYSLPGSLYREPEFSWKYAVAPSPIGFVKGQALGAQFEGDLFVGASRTTLYNGYLFRLRLSTDRLRIAMTDPRLQDSVADNLDKFDITESESLLIGKNFGVTTDIQTGPDGNLYVVSLSNGAVYQIYAAGSPQFTASNAASAQWWKFRSTTAYK